MKKFFGLLIVTMFIFSCCKSNQEAYNSAYRKLKEKNEENQLAERAKTASNVSKEVTEKYKDTTAIHEPENFTLVLGDPINLSNYNIVARSFINRTNAHSYQGLMIDDNYPAVVVQNDELMYRIVIASFKTESDARNKLKQIHETFPDAWILVKR